jgi:MFS family permease
MSDANAVAGRPEPPTLHRWLVLLFISLAMFGNYYLYDTIAPIADLLKSSYSWGAIIFLLPGGIFIDRFGTRAGTMLFGSICAISGFVTMASDNIIVMLVGRFLLGVSAEPLIVAITAAIAKWFKGKELAFAMGINLTIARAYDNWRDPLVIGAFLGLTCVIGAVTYWIVEVRAERSYSLGEAGEVDRLVLSDLFKFNRSFWYITALCVTFYSIIFPFRSFAIKFFIETRAIEQRAAVCRHDRHAVVRAAGGQDRKAGDADGSRHAHSGTGISPPGVHGYDLVPAGHHAGDRVLVDSGHHVAGSGLHRAAELAFSLIPAIMWPAVAYIVAQNRLGSAYALMFLLQQGGVAALAWGVGKANDVAGASAANPEGYLPMMWMFTVLGAVSLLFAFLLWRQEKGPQAHGLETIKA